MKTKSREAFEALRATILRALEKLHYQQWWASRQKESHPNDCDCDICIK